MMQFLASDAFGNPGKKVKNNKNCQPTVFKFAPRPTREYDEDGCRSSRWQKSDKKLCYVSCNKVGCKLEQKLSEIKTRGLIMFPRRRRKKKQEKSKYKKSPLKQPHSHTMIAASKKTIGREHAIF